MLLFSHYIILHKLVRKITTKDTYGMLALQTAATAGIGKNPGQ